MRCFTRSPCPFLPARWCQTKPNLPAPPHSVRLRTRLEKQHAHHPRAPTTHSRAVGHEARVTATFSIKLGKFDVGSDTKSGRLGSRIEILRVLLLADSKTTSPQNQCQIIKCLGPEPT